MFSPQPSITPFLQHVIVSLNFKHFTTAEMHIKYNLRDSKSHRNNKDVITLAAELLIIMTNGAFFGLVLDLIKYN